MISNVSNDFILTRLLNLFNNRAGLKYALDKEKELKAEGETRFKAQIPPGYRDSKKKISDEFDNNAYGDFFVWCQIIDFATVKKSDVIFITNDRKEDWWYEVKGRLIGPRNELLCEFRSKTKKQFHMYTMDSFLTMFSKRNEALINNKVISEVKNAEYKIKELYNTPLNDLYAKTINDEKKLKVAMHFVENNINSEKFYKRYLLASLARNIAKAKDEDTRHIDEVEFLSLMKNLASRVGSEHDPKLDESSDNKYDWLQLPVLDEE